MSRTSRLAKDVQLTLICGGGNHCYGKNQVHVTVRKGREGLNRGSTLQAIFGCNAASMSIGDFLIMEAARMAQSLGYHRPVMKSKEDEAICHRTFWVIYLIEKSHTFIYGMSSVSKPPLLPWV